MCTVHPACELLISFFSFDFQGKNLILGEKTFRIFFVFVEFQRLNQFHSESIFCEASIWFYLENLSDSYIIDLHV